MEDLEDVLGRIDESVRNLAEQRSGSRFVGPGADAALVEHVAGGGSYDPDSRGLRERMQKGETVRRDPTPLGIGGGAQGLDFLRAVAGAARGHGPSFDRLAKAWAEGTPGSGGYFVNPDVLPGYVPAMRAAAPLRARCSEFQVSSDEVWIVTEGNTLTVAMVPEGGTKPNTTGSIAQKVSAVYKAAGVTTLSDELLADSNGNAESIVTSQFAKQIGLTIEQKIHSGSGTGEPTGIRLAAGVAATAVDGQTGQLLYESVLKAVSRIEQRFEPVDTVAIHPRDAIKFALAKTTTDEYLFPDGFALPVGVTVVLDATRPTNLGAGTNESVIILGGFRRGGYFLSRQSLTIEGSRDAGWVTDETLVRGLERFGFAVVVPGAFEVLTGITP